VGAALLRQVSNYVGEWVLRFSDKFQTVWGSECCASQTSSKLCGGVSAALLRQGITRAAVVMSMSYFLVGQNHICTVYIRYFGREITKYTGIYTVCVYVRFWPMLHIQGS